MDGFIEIPFGAEDSELKGWEYTIPDNMEAEIKDGKIIVRQKENKDEKIRKAIIKSIEEDSSVYEQEVTKEQMLAWLEKQKEPTDKGEISDGYHTFNELYYYRMLYNAAFFNLLPKGWVHKSKKHHDGKECFDGGWFIVMANLPTGQISNHYELKDWDLFQIPEKETADEWDGHTPQEAAERIHKYLQEKQGQKISIFPPGLGEAHFNPVSCKTEEQTHYWKPTKTDVDLFNKAVTTNKALTPTERAQLDIIRSKFGCWRAVNCSGIEQKPAGWAGYSGIVIDKTKHPELSDAEWAIVRGFARIAGHSHFPINIIKETAQDFLAHLPAEWSKVDERLTNTTIYFLKDFADKGYENAVECIDWLKSRRLVKQEWSDEDITGLDRALDILRTGRGQILGYDTDDGISEYDDAIRTLERIRPARPHWRPSNEQLRAFEESLMSVAYTENKTILESLYEQLKKL